MNDDIIRMAREAEKEREAMMQLFTDPENQPTQYGTVTVEYMHREIAAEREAVLDLVDDYAKDNTDLRDAIRARGNT